MPASQHAVLVSGKQRAPAHRHGDNDGIHRDCACGVWFRLRTSPIGLEADGTDGQLFQVPL